jgi:hypothetical protein
LGNKFGCRIFGKSDTGNNDITRLYEIDLQRNSIELGSKTATETDVNSIRFGTETRWYYTMKKDIEKGLIADNLNGKYLGLRIGGLRQFNIEPRMQWTSEIVFGLQRQILTHQFIDFNIGAGLGIDKFNIKHKSLIFNYQINYGVIFDKRYIGKKPKNCDALQCYEERNSMFKIDILSLVEMLNKNVYIGGFKMVYEHRLGKSYFTLSENISLNYSRLYLKDGGYSKNTEGYRLNISIEPRFYFNQRKSIAQGESVKNLSGSYLGLNTGFTNIEKQTDNRRYIPSNFYEHIQSGNIHLLYGFQQNLLKNIFFDFKTGIGLITTDNFNLSSYKPSILLDTKLGLAF